MKNILLYIHDKCPMICPWQIFFHISMTNILWYVHEKYPMICLWKIFFGITMTNILLYVQNNFVKSFESAHSIKYSTGVAEPMGKKFHIITCNGAVCQKKENIVLQFWIESSILVLYWINYVWPKLYLREQKPSSAERNHFFWGFADSWVSSESEQCISLLQKHLKSFCLWSISISAARELGMTNHPQIQFLWLHDFLIHILFFPFKACLILCYPTPRSCHKTKLFKSPLTSIDWRF